MNAIDRTEVASPLARSAATLFAALALAELAGTLGAAALAVLVPVASFGFAGFSRFVGVNPRGPTHFAASAFGSLSSLVVILMCASFIHAFLWIVVRGSRTGRHNTRHLLLAQGCLGATGTVYFALQGNPLLLAWSATLALSAVVLANRDDVSLGSSR